MSSVGSSGEILMKSTAYLAAVLAILAASCAVERELPPLDYPEPVLIEPSPVSAAPLAPPMDLGVQKRSRLPTPKRIQHGEVIIDQYITQRPKCDRSPGLPSAAHPTIRCGARVHVVDIETGKETFAVITHRLNLEGDRILYLSPRMGKELGIEKVKGAQAKIEIITKGQHSNEPSITAEQWKQPTVAR